MTESISDQIWDFIVVGGGLNGLAISSLLSNDKKKVLVLEKDLVVGGRVKVIDKNGYKLDNTSRNLLKYAHNSPLNNVINTITEDTEELLRIIPIRDYYLFIGPEKTKDLKPNLHEQKYIEWFNKGWVTVPRNMDQMRKSDYFSSWNLMRIYTTGFKCKYDDIKKKSLTWFINEKKMNEFSARYLKSAACILMHSCNADDISAGELLRTMKYTKMPILFGYPYGGWNQIINKMVKKIKENGKIITDCSVNKLKIDLNQNKKKKSDPVYSVEGVFSAQGIFLSKNVVLAIPPNYIGSFFQNKKGKNVLDKKTQNFIKNLVWTSGISFNFCLKRWAYRGKGLLYFENPYGYGIFVSNLEPTLTPEKKQLMTAFFPLNPEDLKNKEFLEKKVKDCRELIFYHFPKVKERLDFERVTIHEMVDSVLINTFQYKDLRPEPRVKNIAGCYLTGDYLNAYGSGKELGYNSVWKTYSAITEDGEFIK